jgi:hypothetical protein
VLKRNGFRQEMDSLESSSLILLEIVGAIGLFFIEDDIDFSVSYRSGTKKFIAPRLSLRTQVISRRLVRRLLLLHV